MVYRFHGLRHDAVVASNNKDNNVRYLRTSRAHGSKRRVPRGVEECNLSVADLDFVSADVLGDTARFARGNGRVANGVKQRRLTVVNVTHDNNNGIPCFKIVVLVVRIVDKFIFYRNNDLFCNGRAQIFRNKRRGVIVYYLRRRSEYSELHKFLNDLRGRHTKFRGKFGNGHFLGKDNVRKVLFLVLFVLFHSFEFCFRFFSSCGVVGFSFILLFYSLICFSVILVRFFADDVVKSFVIFGKVNVRLFSRINNNRFAES